MYGLAQKLFVEKVGKTPWKNWTVPKATLPWPRLETLLEMKHLSYIDIALAQRFLHNIDPANEGLAALFCHLSMASRQGHLCITIDQDGIYPKPEDIWLPSNDGDLSDTQESAQALLAELAALMIAATESLRPPLLCEINESMDPKNFFPPAPICKQGPRYYFQRYWLQESLFLEHVVPLLSSTTPLIAVDEAHVRSKIDTLSLKKSLLPEQAWAVMQGCLYPFTIITGGPGTGKTHTAGILIRVLWESLTAEQRSKCRIGLAAPTGKAAANLEGSIRRAIGQVEGFPVLTAQTLHALLGLGKVSRDGASLVLPYDVLLVDESSMMDVRMMGQLLAALKPGARLILLGDRYQLPPVEAGSLFSDLVNFMQSHHEKKTYVSELKTCLRAELRTIVDLAAQINQGNEETVLEMLNGAKSDSGIAYVPFDCSQTAKEHQRQLLAYSQARFPLGDQVLHQPLELLKEFSRFRILTPLRKGPLGVEFLNALFLQAEMTRARRFDVFVAPIMIIQNDYRQDLFNGEAGLLVRKNAGKETSSQDLSEGSYAIFASKTNELLKTDVRKIPALMLPKFEYAYCLSVYKSQGSEFEHVVLLLSEGSECFGREALYTGVTRARRALEIWSTPEVLSQMIGRATARHSGIAERLQALI